MPIPSDARAVLERLSVESPSNLIFTSWKTGKRFDNVERSLAKSLELAGIRGVTLHTLRHTYGTRLAAAGVDVAMIKELIGPASITITMRYVHAIGEHKHEAARKLEIYLNRRNFVAMDE